MTRLDPMQYFREHACAALGNHRCYPVVQADATGTDLREPSVVYYRVGHNTTDTTDKGSHATAIALRYEVRAALQPHGGGYREVVDLDKKIVRNLRAGGRLLQLLNVIDDHDQALEIYRVIRSVMIRN